MGSYSYGGWCTYRYGAILCNFVCDSALTVLIAMAVAVLIAMAVLLPPVNPFMALRA